MLDPLNAALDAIAHRPPGSTVPRSLLVQLEQAKEQRHPQPQPEHDHKLRPRAVGRPPRGSAARAPQLAAAGPQQQQQQQQQQPLPPPPPAQQHQQQQLPTLWPHAVLPHPMQPLLFRPFIPLAFPSHSAMLPGFAPHAFPAPPQGPDKAS